ncbi:MAG TPA: hypothetical protein VGJ66_17465 [Pyrinomonadaceae bacterium]|jgi:hypothetical protein
MQREISTEVFVLGLVTGCLFVAIGAFGLFRARRIQRLALEYYARNPDVAQLNLFAKYMAKEAYVKVTRLTGLFILIAGAYCLFVVLKAFFL